MPVHDPTGDSVDSLLARSAPQGTVCEALAIRRIRETLFDVHETELRAGRYVLLELLGEGGGGEVFSAYDPDLDRKVAIKILRGIPEAAQADPRTLYEAKALAKIAHANIVAVYDVGIATVVGSARERLFIAMEYVAGQTVESWLYEKHRDYRDIVAVFLAAGRGLAAAHDAGIVHGDFKPSNVVRTIVGAVKVLDFGLTRPDLLGPHQGEAKIAGTPAFMSPHQHRTAGATMACDQFAVCAALWRALNDTPPYHSETLAGLLAAKLKGPPAWQNRSVPTRVRRAIERGLAPDPEHRFESLTVLLDVLASTSRRRRALWLGGLGGLGGLGATTTAMAIILAEPSHCISAELLQRQLWNDEHRDLVVSTIGQANQPYARQTAESVQRTLTDFSTEWSLAHHQECRSYATGARSATLHDQVVACLDRSARQFVDIRTRVASSEPSRVLRAVKITESLTAVDRCEPGKLLQRPRATASRAEIAGVQALVDQARAAKVAGEPKEALALAVDGLAQVEGLDDIALRLEATLELADVHYNMGHTTQALALNRKAAGLATAEGLHWLRAHAAGSVAHILGQRGEFDRAQDWVFHAQNSLNAAEPDRRANLRLLGVESVLQYKQGEIDAAIVLMRKIIEIRTQVDGEQSTHLIVDRMNLGNALSEAGDLAAAVGPLDQAVASASASLGRSHPDTLDVREARASLLRRLGRMDEARPEMEQVLALRRRVLGSTHPDVGQSLNNLGNLLFERGEYREAKARYIEAELNTIANHGEDSPQMITRLHNLGSLAHTQGEYSRAYDYYARALVIARARVGVRHVTTARVQLQLAATALDDRRFDIAAQQAGEAAAILRETPADPQYLVHALRRQGQAFAKLERGEDAAKLFGEAVAAASDVETISNDWRGRCYLDLSRALDTIEDPAAAREAVATGLALPDLSATVRAQLLEQRDASVSTLIGLRE